MTVIVRAAHLLNAQSQPKINAWQTQVLAPATRVTPPQPAASLNPGLPAFPDEKTGRSHRDAIKS